MAGHKAFSLLTLSAIAPCATVFGSPLGPEPDRTFRSRTATRMAVPATSAALTTALS